jgi:hypothetical protein
MGLSVSLQMTPAALAKLLLLLLLQQLVRQEDLLRTCTVRCVDCPGFFAAVLSSLQILLQLCHCAQVLRLYG